MKAVRVNLFGGSSTKQRPDSEPRSLGDHGSVFRFLGSQLEGKILRGPMWGAQSFMAFNFLFTFQPFSVRVYFSFFVFVIITPDPQERFEKLRTKIKIVRYTNL